LAYVFWALLVPGTSPAAVLYNQTFDTFIDWGSPEGDAAPWTTTNLVGGRLTLRSTRPDATDTNSYDNTLGGYRCGQSFTHQSGHTLVFCADLMGANQDNAFFVLNISAETRAYRLFKDQNEIAVELWSIIGGGHSPTLTNGSSVSEFSPRVIDWLLAHPKP
jgi:hypothetical protein